MPRYIFSETLGAPQTEHLRFCIATKGNKAVSKHVEKCVFNGLVEFPSRC